MKDIFVDLVERVYYSILYKLYSYCKLNFLLLLKFIEPCKENLNKNEVKLFLDEYRKKAHQLQDVCR